MEETTKSRGSDPLVTLDLSLRRNIRKAAALLRTHWWIPLLSVATGVFLAALWNARQPAAYLSEGRMMVSGKISMPEGAVYSEELSSFFGTQTELMRSAELRRLAEERLASTEPELQQTSIRLSVQRIPETAIFKLTAIGESPSYSQKFLDALMTQYMALKKQMRSEKSETTLAAITDELARLEKEIHSGEDDLLEFQKENNVGFLQEQGNSAGNYLVTLNRKLADLKTEYQLLESLDVDTSLDGAQKQKLHALVESQKEAPASTAAGRGNSGDAQGASTPLPVNNGDKQNSSDASALVNGLGTAVDSAGKRESLQALEAERDDFAKVLRPRHPVMVELNKKIAALQATMAQGFDDLKSHRELIRLEVANLEKTVKEWEARALDVGQRMARYDRIKDKVDRAKEVYQRQIVNLRNVNVSMNVDQDIVSVLERASPPEPVKTSLLLSIGVGAVAGLLVGAAFLYIIGERDDRVTSADDAQKQFPDHILAQIPHVAPAGRAGDLVNIVSEKDERHAFTEALRSLRSSLVFLPMEGALPRSLLITSAVPHEGKSTIAANLAVTMAFAYSRVLLIDGDLRRGGAAQIFRPAKRRRSRGSAEG